jgi:PIN domain nuclease of toxin-antitoxin system
MRLLLDTCALLWMVGDPARLSAKARAAMSPDEAELWVSAISAFEVAVKHRKGKLSLPLPAREWFRRALVDYALKELPVTSEIAALAPEVAVPHADPCDRMIIATARLHGLQIVTSDHLIAACKDIEVCW